MREGDKAIAERLRGMDLEELRAEHVRVFGEECRGGAELLRRKIAYGLIEAAERERRRAEEDDDMRTEGRAERLANEALDCEQDLDWSGAADKWRAAASATKSRKREYEDRAAVCDKHAVREELPPEEGLSDVMPDPPDELGPWIEHVDAATAAEAEGDLRRAAAEWELAAGKVKGPERESFLGRAQQLRELAPKAPPAPMNAGALLDATAAAIRHVFSADAPPTPMPAGIEIPAPPDDTEALRAMNTKALERQIEESGRELGAPAPKDERATAVLNDHPLPVNDHPPDVNGAAVEAVTGPGPNLDEALDAILGEEENAAVASARDQRLPEPGSTLRKEFPGGGFVEVLFGAGPEVKCTAADKKHPQVIGQSYASVSGLGRAYRKRNTNGYDWLGLKLVPKAQPQGPGAEVHADQVKRVVEDWKEDKARGKGERVLWMPGALLKTAMAALERRGRIVDGAVSTVTLQTQALAIAVRRTAELFSELADILDSE